MSKASKTPRDAAKELLGRVVEMPPAQIRHVTLPPAQSRQVQLPPAKELQLPPAVVADGISAGGMAGLGSPLEVQARARELLGKPSAYGQMQQMIQGVNLMPHHISSDSQKIAQELLKKTSAKQLQKELTPNTRKVMEKRTWIPGGTYDTDPTGRAIEIAEDT